MKIAQYSVGMHSQHTYTKTVSQTETLRAWVGDQRPDFERMGNGEPTDRSPRVAISDAARQAVAAASADRPDRTDATADTGSTSAIEAVGDDAAHDPKLDLIIRIIEALTGKKIKLMDPSDFGKLSSAVAAGGTELQKTAGQADEQPPRQGWGVEYDYHEKIHESERTSFTAGGEILTADGKRIRFEITLDMSREFYQETAFSFRAGDAVRKDPLVINFEGNAAELTGEKFDFDIDADGEADRISFVSPASGFLALDRNGNGRIDDGRELFGARTGDGFAELAAYDADGNGWIDENDAIFAELRIWTKDSNGADRLSTLAEHNIGALYLGQTATPFDLKDAQYNQHGQILSTGLYLSEDGGAGTIQQLDLFV